MTAEIPEKEENHGNPLLHVVGNPENENLKFIRKPKTRRHKKFGKRLNSWFVKNQSFDISTESVVMANTVNLKKIETESANEN